MSQDNSGENIQRVIPLEDSNIMPPPAAFLPPPGAGDAQPPAGVQASVQHAIMPNRMRQPGPRQMQRIADLTEELRVAMEDLHLPSSCLVSQYSTPALPEACLDDVTIFAPEERVDDAGNVTFRAVTTMGLSYEAMRPSIHEMNRMFLSIQDVLAASNIEPPREVAELDYAGSYDRNAWIVVLYHMWYNCGIPIGANRIADSVYAARVFARRLMADDTLRLDWQLPYNIDENGELTIGTHPIPVIHSHIGSHSIETGGVFSTDVCKMGMTPFGNNTFMPSILDAIRLKGSSVVFMPDAHHFSINSLVTYSRNDVVQGGNFQISARFSQLSPRNTAVIPQHIFLREPEAIGVIEKTAFADYLKGGFVSKNTFNPTAAAVLNANAAQLTQLVGVINEFLDTGLSIYDNTFIYFKLWCNAFARARLAEDNIAPIVPIVADGNSGLRYVQMGDGAPALVLADLKRYAHEQYFAFFEADYTTDAFIIMLEILGYAGMYFTTGANDLVAPWNGFHFPAVNIVAFCSQPRAHQGADINFIDLRAAIFQLAERRGEFEECARGLQLSMELMPCSLHRHHRINNNAGNVQAPAGVVEYHLSGRAELLVPGRDRGGPRDNTEEYVGDFGGAGRGDPDSNLYVGDAFHTGNRATYDPAHYRYVALDAFYQVNFTEMCKPRGNNWVVEMLRVHQKRQRIPAWMEEIRIIDNLNFVQYNVLGYALLQTSTATVNMSNNFHGDIVDEYMRGVGRERFNSFYMMSINNAAPTPGNFNPFYNNIFGVLARLTQSDYSVPGVIRNWNRGRQYGAHHLDRYGVYHLMCGRLPIVGFNVLALESFIYLRPREWGIVVPGAKANLRDAIIQTTPEAANGYVVTYTGNPTLNENHAVSAYAPTYATYNTLLVNAVRSSFMRQLLNIWPRYHYKQSNERPEVGSWTLAAIHEYPVPILVAPAAVFLPGSIISYDWRHARYLAVCLQVPRVDMDAILSHKWFPDPLDGAGLYLNKKLPLVTTSLDVRYGAQPAWWQKTTPAGHYLPGSSNSQQRAATNLAPPKKSSGGIQKKKPNAAKAIIQRAVRRSNTNNPGLQRNVNNADNVPDAAPAGLYADNNMPQLNVAQQPPFAQQMNVQNAEHVADDAMPDDVALIYT